MTIKDLHMDAKRNRTTEQVCQQYGFATAKDLFDTVTRIAGVNKAKEFKRMLTANDKLARRTVRATGSEEATSMEVIIPEKIIPTEEVTEADVGVFSTEEMAGAADEVATLSKVNRLEVLRAEEAKLSDEVIALEKEHKALCSSQMERRTLRDELSRNLQELAKQVEKLAQQVETLESRYMAVSDEMKSKSSEISVRKALLEEIREQIDILSRMVVYIYADGTVEVENGEFVYDEDKAKEYFNELLQYHEAEGVTVKTLRAISRVKAMGGEFELVFESEEARILFEQL